MCACRAWMASPRWNLSHGKCGAPIIVITAFGDLATAVDAINKGAFEYVVKPFDIAEISAVIERAPALRTGEHC